MIKYSNDDFLKRRFSIDDKNILFYQVWKELTNDKTIDTYQFHMMNTLSAIQELDSIIDQRLGGFINNDYSVNECREKLLRIAADDGVLKEFYPIIHNMLLDHLGKKLDTVEKYKSMKYILGLYYD